MILKRDDLETLLAIAIKAAKAAGSIIEGYRNKSFDIISKEAGDTEASQVFTQADLESQNTILTYLNPTLKSYDLGILLEEDNDDGSRFIKDYFWSVDPLDGTLSFIKGYSGYSVSIALVSKEGRAVIGVVYDPYKKNIYYTIKGSGVFKNGEKWLPNKKGDSLTLIYDRSFTGNKHYNRTVKHIKELANELNLHRVNIIDNLGAVLNALSVIERSPGIYFKFPKKSLGGGSLWDFSATSLIVDELEGQSSDIYGNPIELNRKESTFLNHRGIIYSSNIYLSKKIQRLFKSLTSL